MNKNILTSSGLFMAIALLLAINIISDVTLKSMRLDLTDSQLYTLSDGTKNILKNIDEPITLRFYLSQKIATSLPSINTYAVRVRELLEEYQRIAADNLKLMIIDPEPFSEAEDSAEAYGIQGIPVDDNNTIFYFGLAGTNSTDEEEIIAFFSPNRAEFLEYDLTKLIYQLSNPKQKVVGIMSTLPVQDWMIVEQIRQLFQVQTIEIDVETIPEEIDVLMLIHPKEFSETTLYAIDQFVLKGKRAIVFADPYSEVYEPPTDPQNPLAAMQATRNSELSQLFDAWGLELVSNKVIGDLRTAQKVQVRNGSRAVIINYPVWMDLDNAQYFNQTDIVTGKLGNIVLATPGALVEKGDVSTEFIPLIETGEKAMQIDITKLGMFSAPEDLARDFKPEGKFTLAARITGKVKTAFPDGNPNSEDNTQHIIESTVPINLIIVADTDILEDKFWVSVQNILGQRLAMPHAENGTFITNALDNLAGSNDLISVRNRGNFARPFTRVQAIQQEAEQRFREKEKELQARLEQTEQKISSLQNKKQDSNDLMLNIAQQQEIASFRGEKIKIRKELRNVQHELQKDIERLETQMKFINIGLMPLLIVFLGILLSIFGRRRLT